MIDLGLYFPFWKELTAEQRYAVEESANLKTADRGAVLHRGRSDCVGLLLVTAGQLRVYSTSEEGREITLYRLFERDVCILSASCVLNSIQFDVTVEAEQESEILYIPADVYHALMKESAAVANYTNELMAGRFSEVMWLMDQVMNKRMDSRLSAFLLEESAVEGGDELEITHEMIARHLGSAREVITRMLKYLQKEGCVSLSRGKIILLDRRKLKQAADAR